jgi:hypothetical protein
MGFSFMDFMEIAAPIGVAMIPGVGIPASIALSAAMKGGGTALKGGGIGEILRDTAIGGATGAAGAGTAGAISKFAGKAGGAAVEQGGKVATEAFAEGGPDMFAKAAKALTKAGGRQKAAQGVSKAFSGALGDDPEKTAAMLNVVKKGGNVAGGLDQAYQFATETPTFSQHNAAASRHPGMNPAYQFGGTFSDLNRGGTQTLGFLGGY